MGGGDATTTCGNCAGHEKMEVLRGLRISVLCIQWRYGRMVGISSGWTR